MVDASSDGQLTSFACTDPYKFADITMHVSDTYRDECDLPMCELPLASMNSFGADSHLFQFDEHHIGSPMEHHIGSPMAPGIVSPDVPRD